MKEWRIGENETLHRIARKPEYRKSVLLKAQFQGFNEKCSIDYESDVIRYDSEQKSRKILARSTEKISIIRCALLETQATIKCIYVIPENQRLHLRTEN